MNIEHGSPQLLPITSLRLMCQHASSDQTQAREARGKPVGKARG